MDYENEDTFQITLSSNASKSIYPHNNPSSFTTCLQKPIELELDRWEFALMSMLYPTRCLNNVEDCSIGIVIRQYIEPGRARALETLGRPSAVRRPGLLDQILSCPHPEFFPPVDFVPGKMLRFVMRYVTIPKATFRSIADLCQYLCDRLNEHTESYCEFMKLKDSKLFTFEINARTGFVTFNCQKIPLADIWLIVKEPYLLQHRLGILPAHATNGEEHYFSEDQIRKVSEKADSNFIFLYEFPARGKILASLENPPAIYVYTDIAKHQLVGDSSAQLLAIVPTSRTPTAISEEDSDAHTYHVENPPYYIPLETNSFSRIEIQLRTDWGMPFPFQGNPNNRAVCRLNFRRRQLPRILG